MPPPQKKKKIGGQKCAKFGRFRTTLDFDRKYLWGGSRCQKSEKQVTNYTTHPTLGEENMMNFDPLTKGYRPAC